MRIVFFGSPEFAVPTLRMLLGSSHEVVAVVTQPDKVRGRGRKVSPTPVKALAEEHGIPVLQPTSVRTDEFLSDLQALQPDVAVVVAYGKIVPKSVLDTPVHGCLNIHASLLPAYRGAGPIQWAIINGETTTGVSIMQMDEGMDTGPVVAMKEVDILEDDDAISLANLLSHEGASLMEEVLDTLQASGKLESTPQDESKASHAPLIQRDMARIDWNTPTEKIICAVRGFMPWPKAYTTLKDTELKITGVDACHPDWVPPPAFRKEVPPGMVVEILKGRGFIVRTGGEKGVLLVTRVLPPGKGEMGAIDFVNGGGISVGDRLGD